MPPCRYNPVRARATQLAANEGNVSRIGVILNFIYKTIGLSVATVALLISGCASIVGDSKPKVGIYSQPTGAKYDVVSSTGRVVVSGVTPGNVILETSRGYFKRESYSVIFHKQGRADTTVPLKSSISGWYWGNIAFGGIIGMLIVDPLTGAMYTLPEDVVGTLPSTVSSTDAKTPEMVSLEQVAK